MTRLRVIALFFQWKRKITVALSRTDTFSFPLTARIDIITSPHSFCSKAPSGYETAITTSEYSLSRFLSILFSPWDTTSVTCHDFSLTLATSNTRTSPDSADFATLSIMGRAASIHADLFPLENFGSALSTSALQHRKKKNSIDVAWEVECERIELAHVRNLRDASAWTAAQTATIARNRIFVSAHIFWMSYASTRLSLFLLVTPMELIWRRLPQQEQMISDLWWPLRRPVPRPPSPLPPTLAVPSHLSISRIWDFSVTQFCAGCGETRSYAPGTCIFHWPCTVFAWFCRQRLLPGQVCAVLDCRVKPVGREFAVSPSLCAKSSSWICAFSASA